MSTDGITPHVRSQASCIYSTAPRETRPVWVYFFVGLRRGHKTAILQRIAYPEVSTDIMHRCKLSTNIQSVWLGLGWASVRECVGKLPEKETSMARAELDNFKNVKSKSECRYKYGSDTLGTPLTTTRSKVLQGFPPLFGFLADPGLLNSSSAISSLLEIQLGMEPDDVQTDAVVLHILAGFFSLASKL
ncbi:hypothetical protein TWF730_006933 [Orbilia blumenaviensis]|uniref:Uncharacterized protein n=1 Tax=Orbilia blumenaviensis TaxID=1796055 RepID=A0AAV9VFR4_9PEZI